MKAKPPVEIRSLMAKPAGEERRVTGAGDALRLPLAKAFGEQSFNNESLATSKRRLRSLGRRFAFSERQGEIRIVARRATLAVGDRTQE